MGNSSNSVITIQLDSRFVSVGNPLSGNVHCELSSPLDAGVLDLELTGTEMCEWRDILPTKEPIRQKGTRRVAQHVVSLCTLDGEEYSPGSYSFPFEFPVPETFPASFFIKQPPCTEAEVWYSVVAYLKCDDWVVKSEPEYLTVGSRPAVIKSLEESVSASMLTWCFFSQGEAHLTVHIDKNAYKPGEIMQISLEIDNSESKLDITSVSATLSRRIRLRSNTGRSTISSQTISSCSSDHSVCAGESSSQKLLQLPVKLTFPGIKKAPTVKGMNIECVYFLTVSAETGGAFMCCGGLPEVVREVVIYSGEQREKCRVEKKKGKKREDKSAIPSVE